MAKKQKSMWLLRTGNVMIRLSASLGVLGICSTFLLTGGCKKKTPEAPPSPAMTNEAIAAGVTAQVAPPDVAEITRQLRRWILKNQRPPKNFEDFAATTTYQIPPPPPGKKYTIDRQMHVLLVDR